MDRSYVINLIEPHLEPNEFGAYEAVEFSDPLVEYDLSIEQADPIQLSERLLWISTEVFCDVRSITRTEWFEAGRNGIEHPAFIFIINRNEYSGEPIVEYNGQWYGVYRTYAAKNEDLELYCEAKGGLHDGAQDQT